MRHPAKAALDVPLIGLLFYKVLDHEARELDDQIPELLILLAQKLEFGLLSVGRRQLGEMGPFQLR
jgi:hypothetical protein